MRALILLGLTVAFVWLAWSVGGALTAPGTDSVSARIAEWARTHDLGWLVSRAEQVQYDLHKPKTGGTVSGGIPTVDAPSRSSRADQGSVLHHLAAPKPLMPLASPALAGEGRWQGLFQVRGRQAARVAFLRPDGQHTSYLVAVVWMDPTLLKFELHPGYELPGGKLMAADRIPSAERPSILAAFNSGFQMADSHGGYWQDGHTSKALRAGAASMVFTADGHLRIEVWPGGRPGRGIVAVRQNLTPLIDNGVVSPLVASATTQTWGNTVGNAAYVWRSAIGVRADGSIVSVVGPAMDVQSLTNVLKRAGAVNAMELDINPEWTSYITFSHPSGGTPVAKNLISTMMSSPDRYLQPSSRDFVAVLPR